MLLQVPEGCSKTVWLLDDGKDADKAAWVAGLGAGARVRYVAGRKRSKGALQTQGRCRCAQRVGACERELGVLVRCVPVRIGPAIPSVWPPRDAEQFTPHARRYAEQACLSVPWQPRRAHVRHVGLACVRLRSGACADEVNGKAGNLNHALRLMYPRGAPVAPGEVVAVFDCDQARRTLSALGTPGGWLSSQCCSNTRQPAHCWLRACVCQNSGDATMARGRRAGVRSRFFRADAAAPARVARHRPGAPRRPA